MSVNILRYNPSKMAKTNYEILLWYGEEMDVAYKEKEKKLKTLDKLGLSEPVKVQARKDIFKAFYDKMEEIKRKPLYEEALKSARKEWAMKHKIYRAKNAYEKAEELYKAAQIDYRWEVEEETKAKDEVKDTKEELYWDKDKIIKNLKKKVEVEEDVDYMWYKWKKVRINLPAVWNFEWFKFEYFVSNATVYKEDFESNPELKNKSYSVKDVWKLLRTINKYMNAMGVVTDWDMDYKNDLKEWKTKKCRCNAWNCLKDIAWLDNRYWLKDNNVDRKIKSRAIWNCRSYMCRFSRLVYDHSDANLFLKLS